MAKHNEIQINIDTSEPTMLEKAKNGLSFLFYPLVKIKTYYDYENKPARTIIYTTLVSLGIIASIIMPIILTSYNNGISSIISGIAEIAGYSMNNVNIGINIAISFLTIGSLTAHAVEFSMQTICHLIFGDKEYILTKSKADKIATKCNIEKNKIREIFNNLVYSIRNPGVIPPASIKNPLEIASNAEDLQDLLLRFLKINSADDISLLQALQYLTRTKQYKKQLKKSLLLAKQQQAHLEALENQTNSHNNNIIQCDPENVKSLKDTQLLLSNIGLKSSQIQSKQTLIFSYHDPEKPTPNAAQTTMGEIQTYKKIHASMAQECINRLKLLSRKDSVLNKSNHSPNNNLDDCSSGSEISADSDEEYQLHKTRTKPVALNTLHSLTSHITPSGTQKKFHFTQSEQNIIDIEDKASSPGTEIISYDLPSAFSLHKYQSSEENNRTINTPPVLIHPEKKTNHTILQAVAEEFSIPMSDSSSDEDISPIKSDVLPKLA